MVLDVGVLGEAARNGDHRGARQSCLDAASGGMPMADIVDALARVQIEIGERWLDGTASVADEHRSTAAVDAALAALELRLPPLPAARPVICVCAEGEWHAVASRMVALVFAAAGRATVFLGPSLPAGELARFVLGADAVAAAVTCSTVAALPGAARCVGAVTATGLPVVVGGHAFRAVPAAAEALGAQYVDDLGAAVAAVDSLAPSQTTAALDDAGVTAFDLARSPLLEVATNGLLTGRGLGSGEAQVVYEAVDYALGFGRAAVLLRDRSVLRDHRPWLDAFLRGRAVALSADDVLAGVGCAVAEVLRDRKELHPVLAL